MQSTTQQLTQLTEKFPKSTVTRNSVEKERELRLAAGAISSDLKEDSVHYILVTAWPVIST